MQIVIAKYYLGRITQLLDATHCRKRLWPPVNEITQQPQPVFVWDKIYGLQQRFEFIKAPLNIANCVGGQKNEAS